MYQQILIRKVLRVMRSLQRCQAAIRSARNTANRSDFATPLWWFGISPRGPFQITYASEFQRSDLRNRQRDSMKLHLMGSRPSAKERHDSLTADGVRYPPK